jgi:MinD-like ATPase involved in chromosome partitioning or flagellar assembly
MLLACWSAKGGAGTTVVAGALALLASRAARDALLVDLAGDAAAALGIEEPTGPGVADWLTAGDDVPADALGRLEIAVTPRLALLPRGTDASRGLEHRGDVLAAVLASDGRPVVVDCGTLASSAAMAIAAAADRSLLVTRPCFLALRRALAAPIAPTGVVVVHEEWRALSPADIADAIDVPIVATVDVDPAIARAVDAGLLHTRLPRALERSLRDAA